MRKGLVEVVNNYSAPGSTFAPDHSKKHIDTHEPVAAQNSDTELFS